LIRTVQEHLHGNHHEKQIGARSGAYLFVHNSGKVVVYSAEGAAYGAATGD
jgi:hypothetical protein